jgi:uncharacterized protein DUF5666
MTPTEADPRARLRRRDVLRIGVLAGACVALALSAVVVLAASPVPPAVQPTASAKTSQPGKLDRPAVKLPLVLRGFGFGFGGAGGRAGAPGVGRAGITISAIHGSSLDLRTDDGWTRTISVGSTTKITKAGQTAALADLAVGDRIAIRETKNADGSYTVVAIVVPTPMVGGTVSAIGPTSLTLKLRDGSTRTVALTGSTTYRLGRADATKSDVKVGSVVIAAGTTGPNDAFTASSVQVVVKLARVGGTVTATTKDTITVKQRDGSSATIHVGSGAKITVRGATNPTVASIAIGMQVQAWGTRNADGSLAATYVFAGQPKTKVAPGGTASPG